MQRQATELRTHYDADLFYLVLAATFVRNWMGNEVVASWLRSNHPKFAVTLGRLAAESDFAIESGRPMKLPYAPAGSAVHGRKARHK